MRLHGQLKSASIVIECVIAVHCKQLHVFCFRSNYITFEVKLPITKTVFFRDFSARLQHEIWEWPGHEAADLVLFNHVLICGKSMLYQYIHLQNHFMITLYFNDVICHLVIFL